jgi:cyclohexadienyl dehydratase
VVAILVGACALLRTPPAPPLRVGTSGDYAPFSLARGDALDGLDIDVAWHFARDLGRPLELVRFRWPELRQDLAAGRFDLAMGGITIRPERVLGASFTRPIVETHAVVVASPGAPVELDRPEVRLAVNAGGHLERVARRVFPHATLVRADDNRTLPALVRGGAADALLTDDLEAIVFIAELPGAVQRAALTRDRKAYLGRDPALVARLDDWLGAREADGTLAVLRARWLGASERRDRFASDLDALLALIDLRLSLMPAVAAAKEVAGRPVEDPAQEERVRTAVASLARTHALSPAAVEALFTAQLDAARVMQRTFLATPIAERPEVQAADLERELRPALAALSATIVARAADVAREPAALAALDAAPLAERLDALVPLPARLALARTIVALAAGGDAPIVRGLPSTFYARRLAIDRATGLCETP